MKKIVSFGVAVVMLFVVTAFSGCNSYQCECKPYVHECTEECGDFCLSISVLGCTRLERGGSINVEITFRNRSGEDIEIFNARATSNSPSDFSIAGNAIAWRIPVVDRLVENQDSIKITHTFTRSGHPNAFGVVVDIQFFFTFWLFEINDIDFWSGIPLDPEIREQAIRISSNIIQIVFK